jgi:benzoyl-CoA reductase subunit BamC
MCVQVCTPDALTFVEREVPLGEDEAVEDDLEIALAAMADKHGWQRVLDTAARLAKKG